jgi:hypothetical protein
MSPDLALQQFQKAAALDPKNPAIKTQIGVSEIDIGQSEQGLARSSRCSAPAPIAGPTLAVMNLHAQWLYKAAEVASALIKRDAKNPIYHTLLGIEYCTTGAPVAIIALASRG